MKQKERKPKQKAQSDTKGRAAGQTPPKAPKQKPPKVRQGRLFLVAIVVLLLGFIAGSVIYKNQKSNAAVEAYQRNKSTYVRDHSPAMGNPAAKVEIVEFFDPACETCREFSPLVKRLMASNPDRIRLYLRYAPFHKGSDYVVRILEAAKRQGKFWETLDAVFASQGIWAPHHNPQPQMVMNLIGKAGLDMARLRQDMDSPEIDRIIQQDLADASALNVKMTPEFFVNGRPLPSFGAEQLKDLVVSELDRAY